MNKKQELIKERDNLIKMINDPFYSNDPNSEFWLCKKSARESIAEYNKLITELNK